MNVVFVIHDLKGNGAERVVLNLANLFKDAGASVSIVVFKKLVEFEPPDGVPIYTFNPFRVRALPRRYRGVVVAPFFDRFIRKHCGDPSLVISNLAHADRILAYSRLPNVHLLIHSVVSYEMKGIYGDRSGKELAERLHLYRKKPLLAISRGVQEDLQSMLPGHGNIKQIYNPIDLDRISVASTEPLSSDFPAGSIVHVGKFSRWKRQSFLLEAYALANIDRPLVFVGQGPLLSEVQEQALNLGVSHKVHFLGFQANPYPVISNAGLLALSSSFEGLSMVLLEALALGTPAISTDCPCGPREILPDSNLVPPNDLVAFSELLKKVSSDPTQWITPFPKQFRTEVIMDQYLNLARF